MSYLIEHRGDPEIGRFLDLAAARRPEIEIFDIVQDPACLKNLAGDAAFAATEAALQEQFESILRETGDPRILDGGEIFETYPRVSSLRSFPMPDHVRTRWTQMKSQGWIPLFNGRDLSGWKSSPPQDAFEVVNGMIKAQPSRDQAHLFYNGDVHGADFEDFELLVDVMTTPGSNSGVYFHTRYQDKGFPDHGHEVQVNNTHKNKNRTGSLFSVQDVEESSIPDHVFFHEHIIVKGRHVTIRVNGETTVDYEEPEEYMHQRFKGRKVDHGTFALQAHDPQSVVYFREIWVRPLESR